MQTEILMVVAMGMFVAIGVAMVWVFKNAEYVIMFTSKQTFKGVWAVWKGKIKNGKISIDGKTYLVGNTKPFIFLHKAVGHVPCYFLYENNPEPMGLYDHKDKKHKKAFFFPRSKLTAKAVEELGEMAAVEKIMGAFEKNFGEVLLFVAIGVALGGCIVFAMLFMGVIDVPVGVCISNPDVVAAVQNMTMMGVVN